MKNRLTYKSSSSPWQLCWVAIAQPICMSMTLLFESPWEETRVQNLGRRYILHRLGWTAIPSKRGVGTGQQLLPRALPSSSFLPIPIPSISICAPTSHARAYTSWSSSIHLGLGKCIAYYISVNARLILALASPLPHKSLSDRLRIHSARAARLYARSGAWFPVKRTSTWPTPPSKLWRLWGGLVSST